MVKRLSNASQMAQSKMTSLATNDNERNQGVKPFPKPSPAVILIIFIIFCFLGNVAYQTYDELKLLKQKQKTETTTCLMDFGKLNCNPLSPSQQCTPVVNCLINDKPISFELVEIAMKELEENFIAPSIMVGLLLILRLCQIISEKKDKII